MSIWSERDFAVACKIITSRTATFWNKTALETRQLARCISLIVHECSRTELSKIIVACRIIKARAGLCFPKILTLGGSAFTTHSFCDESSFPAWHCTFPTEACCGVLWQRAAPGLQSPGSSQAFWWWVVALRAAQLTTCMSICASTIMYLQGWTAL